MLLNSTLPKNHLISSNITVKQMSHLNNSKTEKTNTISINYPEKLQITKLNREEKENRL